MKIFKDTEQEQENLKTEIAHKMIKDIDTNCEKIYKLFFELKTPPGMVASSLSTALFIILEQMVENDCFKEKATIQVKTLMSDLNKLNTQMIAMGIKYHSEN